MLSQLAFTKNRVHFISRRSPWRRPVNKTQYQNWSHRQAGVFNVLKKSIEPFLRFLQKRSNSKKLSQNYYANDLRKTYSFSRSRTATYTKLSRRKIFSKRHILTVFPSHFIKSLIIFRCIYYYYAKFKVENVFAIYFKTNIQNFFVLVYLVCHTPQFEIVQNFNFTVFEDFCLPLSCKYRFSQNVNRAKVQSKTNKYCKFHVDPTRWRLFKSRFLKWGMVPKTLYRNTLKPTNFDFPKWQPESLISSQIWNSDLRAH